ncbi:hypothetical protein B484DRAFT_458733 [Ochromonadaceae sp. CCMP2298]|nr:hypothetical protein B484DRAFT_458733 [Ochromonadaceae sp. CCMP2298]|mmetsp:Transcript_11546/g.25663  ORF Transcript_11546/g.25663 Transcript_11546/m.25663 type:complete len:152 (+) Transcript_11546:76-531(+)
MVRHGTQKKRRSGRKVTRVGPKHRVMKIANSVVNADIQKMYDKNKTPSENLTDFGLVSDVNNLKGRADSTLPLSKHAAFVGFGTVIDGETKLDTNPRRKPISEFDCTYAAANIKKHGDDYKAMERDIKLNSRQNTAKQMERLCRKYVAEQE